MTRTLISLFFLTACGQTGGTPGVATTANLQSALEQPDGALSDDPSALNQTESADADAGAAGTSLDSREAQPPSDTPSAPNDTEPKTPAGFLTAHPSGKIFFVRLAWGNFPVNPDNKDKPVDYSGTVTASTGDTLRHIRSWHFDNNDSIVRPRTDKASIAFTSSITVASDGLHFAVLSPDGTGTITIALGAQFTKTIDIATLDRLRETDASATAGQSVRLFVDQVQRRSLACTSGSLQGRWVSKTMKDGRSAALLVGRVLDETGTAEARVVGIAGQRKNGKDVIFMRVFKTGALVARVRGTFDPSAHTFTAAVFGPLGKLTVGGSTGAYADGIDSVPGSFEGSWQIGADCKDKVVADAADQPQ